MADLNSAMPANHPIDSNTHHAPRSHLIALGLLMAMLTPNPSLPQPDSAVATDTSEVRNAGVYEAEPITVTATRYPTSEQRLPYAFDHVGPIELRIAQPTLSLEPALRSVPGVFISNRHNLSLGDRISIRGLGSRASFGVRGIKVLLDGVPLTLPDGQSQLNNLDLASVGHIQILRGPSAALYGNAAGGALIAETQPAASRPLGISSSLTLGDDSLIRGHGRVSGTLGRTSYFLSFSRLSYDGFREHSAAQSTQITALGRFRPSPNLELSAVLNLYDAPYLLNPGTLNKGDAQQTPRHSRVFIRQQAAGKQVRQGQAGVTLRYSKGRSALEVTLYAVRRSLFNPIPGRIIDLHRTAGGMRSIFTFSDTLGLLFRWSVGLDLESQFDIRTEYDNRGLSEDDISQLDPGQRLEALEPGAEQLNQKERVLGWGAFSQIELRLSERWWVTAGLRHDAYDFEVQDRLLADGADDSGSRTMAQLSPTLGLTYRLHPGLTVFANFSTAFQTPTTSELSNRPTGAGGFNPNLGPETVHSYEAGARGFWSAARLEYAVSLYRMNIHNMLIPFQVPNTESEQIFFRNAGRARNYGAEFQLIWQPVSKIGINAAYTYTNLKFTDYRVPTSTTNADTRVQLAGNRLPGVPLHHLLFGLRVSEADGPGLELRVRWVDDYFANDFNGSPPGRNALPEAFINDGYITFDLTITGHHQVSRFELQPILEISNVFDTRYNGSIIPNAFGERYYEPAPGRRWKLTLRASY